MLAGNPQTARKLSHDWVFQQAEERVLISDVDVLLALRSMEGHALYIIIITLL